ncbi:MAG TPA: anthranilate synthase component I [Bacteroidota bacterium]|nr:anthranilate synthase component I [Bacteroidota bacterium]
MDQNEFRRLASTFNVIPLTRTLLADLQTPVSAYLSLRQDSRSSFLFESVEPNERVGRFSFIGVDPVILIRGQGPMCEVVEQGATSLARGTVFDVLASYTSRYKQAPLDGFEGLIGGFVGYLGYDTVRHLERLPGIVPAEGRETESIFGLFDDIVRFDHFGQSLTIVHNVFVDPGRDPGTQYDEGVSRLETIELKLRRPAVAASKLSLVNSISDATPKEAYCEAVARAKHYIVEGDIFQVVLSRRLDAHFTGDLFPVYRALRVINPSPYLFYLEFGNTVLVGSSPEVLVRVHRGEAEVLPIAGTRPRGRNEEEDLALERELLHDEKELAEHIMLVDLGRNDVGRIADFGSVSVPVLKRIERYSHVMHIVSEVKGRLRTGISTLDALKACFPAGTVSGAPKVRAMEIIAELEPFPRGAYAGAVGYLGLNGELDTCIAIRTIVAHDDSLSIQVGAGIVADSVPEREYEETVNKSRAMLAALRRAAEGLHMAPVNDQG